MASTQDWPKARTEGLVAERVDEELVIYDEHSQTAHSLSHAAALVWEYSDGERTPAEIADAVGLAPEMVERAVTELRGCGLLEQPPGYSRREATIKFAKVGGAALAAPLIYSAAIGPATAAASCRAVGSSCTTGSQCCTGICTSSLCACLSRNTACSSTTQCCSGLTCNASHKCV